MLGSPIGHSLSPVLHRAAYADLGLTDWTYEAVECVPAALPETLRRLEAAGLAGVALTMPLKRAVFPLLARVERLAADVEAINTVLFGGVAGQWWGGNTDVPGLVGIVQGADLDVRDGAAPVVLGAGATAASAIAALAEVGVRSVRVAARRAEAVEEIAVLAARFGVQVTGLPLSAESLSAAATDTALMIATLPAGAADPLAGRLLPRAGGLLVDVVYAGWPTPLALAWSAAGGTVVGGLELLVRQAAVQIRLMTGHDPDLGVMRVAGERALAERAEQID